MKRHVIFTSVALALTILGVSPALAVNSLVVESKTVNKGQAGVVIAVRLTNDVPLRSLVIPLILREVTGGAFVTALQPLYGERLPTASGSPLADISIRNQYADENGSCKAGHPGGMGALTFNDGASHPVAAAPEGVMFVRSKIIGANLPAGIDTVGSMSLLVDVTTTQGVFEIDTTCTNPANHILLVRDNPPTNTSYVPDFTKGIINVGHPPVARDTSWSTNEDVPRPVTYLPASDPDLDPLTFNISSGPEHGVITLFMPANGAFTYTPSLNYNGPDSIRFTASDGGFFSNVGTVRITVKPVNDAPTARDTVVTTAEDTPVNALFQADDIDGDALTFTKLSGPFHGTFSGFDAATGAFTYTPAFDYNGADSITFRAKDGVLNSNTATVRITVTPVNDAPVARDTLVVTGKDVPATARFQSFDIDGGPPVYARLTGPFNGIFTGFDPSTGVFTYTPSPGYAGHDSITFDVSDGLATSNVGTVRINVTTTFCRCDHVEDPNIDGAKDVLDVVDVIDVVFDGLPFPIYPPCRFAYEDVNCDCSIDVLDVVKIIAVVFENDPSPPCDLCAAICR